MLRITIDVVKDGKVVSQVAQANVANVTDLAEISDYVAEARVRTTGMETTERLAARVTRHPRRRGALLLCARVLLKLAARVAPDRTDAQALDRTADLPALSVGYGVKERR